MSWYLNLPASILCIFLCAPLSLGHPYPNSAHDGCAFKVATRLFLAFLFFEKNTELPQPFITWPVFQSFTHSETSPTAWKWLGEIGVRLEGQFGESHNLSKQQPGGSSLLLLKLHASIRTDITLTLLAKGSQFGSLVQLIDISNSSFFFGICFLGGTADQPDFTQWALSWVQNKNVSLNMAFSALSIWQQNTMGQIPFVPHTWNTAPCSQHPAQGFLPQFFHIPFHVLCGS